MKSSTKLLYTITTLILVYAFIEGMAFSTFWIINKKPFSFKSLYSKQNRIAKQKLTPDYMATGEKHFQVLHPYLGYVMTPEGNTEELKKQFGITVSPYGFFGQEEPVQKKSPETVIIGILGGSFAVQFFNQTTNELTKQLQQAKELQNKKFVFICLAMPGYKQPQQLLALNYILALGGQFDIVINLDGFNDIALPGAENFQSHVFPFFPRHWQSLAQNYYDPNEQALIGETLYLKEKRKAWASYISKKPLRYSITLNTLWEIYNTKIADTLTRNRLILQTYHSKQATYCVTGPPYNYKDAINLYGDLTNCWKTCSLLIDTICRENAIRYYHFLQPNQYVPKSKKMLPFETRLALWDEQPYKKGVIEGYPKLIAAGTELLTRGVWFYDLTMIFSDIEEPFYIDNCCHLNKAGYHVVGEEIGKSILETYSLIH